MAISFQTTEGTLIVPGAYPSIKVSSSPSNNATSGIIIAIGEADAGPRFSDEADISLNAFGPDAASDVLAKYKSGPLVDAFMGAVAASNDPNITQTFNRMILVKTNASTAAVGTLPRIGGGVYANLLARLSGKGGNQITRTVTQAQAETLPSTGAAVIAPPQVSTNVEFRVNGGAAVTASLTTGELPSAIASAIDALSGVAASGGVNRAIMSSDTGTVTVAVVSGAAVTFTRSVNWDVIPTVGDILYIPTGSPFATANEGTYVVTAATATVISAYKLLDAAGGGSSFTSPTGEGPISIGATTDIAAFSPIVISVEAGAVVPGLGKSLEIADTATGSFAAISFAFAGATSAPPAALATWVSVSGTPTVLTSATEYEVKLTTARQTDGVSDDVTAGGDIALTFGYTGDTASAVIASGVMTITVTGGSGTNRTITLSDYATVGALVAFLNTLTGFTAAAGTAAAASTPAVNLDAGTYTLATKWGAKTGRIKSDGADFLAAVNAGSSLVTVSPAPPATALIGLPDVASLAFLSGGTKGATAQSDVAAAFVACQAIRGNFVVPLFSVDAAKDIVDGLTDPASTYSIDSINALLRSHCLLMSQLKQRRPRQGFASKRDTFAVVKTAAANMASARISMAFQDVRDTNSAGSLTQFRPWMAAVKAAAMQAGGFYRDITAKFINISGALQAAGDFNDQEISQQENAILSGLLTIVRDESGGFKWVEDQTTYTLDDNFVFNSIQAVYAADTVAQSVAQRMEKAFVGQSLGDVSAAVALSTLEGIMSDMLTLKLIARSDDAPKGFKSAKVRITNGNVMQVSLEIKLDTSVKFIPISFIISAVQQSAG
jgi:uncharacterized RmlC-like cupin family protein